MHKDFEKVEYFLKVIEGFESKIETLFAFDQAKSKINKSILKQIDDAGSNINSYINGKNEGKLKLLSNAVKKIETDFFKIVDYDDELYLNDIDNINEKLNYIDITSLVRHKGAKIYSHDNIKQSLDPDVIMDHIKKSKNMKYFQQTNFDTIYPTLVAKLLSEVNVSRQNFHNDVFLSNFIYGLSGNITEIDNYLYIQFHAKGQTSKYNIDRANSIIELYENYQKTKEVFNDFNFKILMKGKKIAHYFFIKYFTKDYVKRYDKEKSVELFDRAKTTWKNNYKK